MSLTFGRVLTAAAALSLAATPAVAAQSSASALSLRASTTTENASNLEANSIIAGIALIAFATGVIIVATNDDEDPDSP